MTITVEITLSESERSEIVGIIAQAIRDAQNQNSLPVSAKVCAQEDKNILAEVMASAPSEEPVVVSPAKTEEVMAAIPLKRRI